MMYKYSSTMNKSKHQFTEEIWKDIKGQENRYQVSSLGRVRSLDRVTIDRIGRKRIWKGRLLSPCKSSDGYLVICLKITGRPKIHKVHRLVAIAFLGDFSEKLEVNHIDGDKTNNNYINLEWCTHSYNMYHAHKMDLCKCKFGSQLSFAKLNEAKVKNIRDLISQYNYSQIARMYGVSSTTISDIVKRKTWRHI